ncbi:MAG: hypothetical protein IPK42_10895 [Betaproteobacteria bacterium]|nr:hypothetical protein [Betaproteobacteria bacterium]
MTTKTITRPLSHWLPDIATRDDVPVNWLASLSTRIKAEIPDDEESGAVIRGLGACTVSWPHTLTPTEQLQATIAEMQATAAQIRALLPIDGGVSLRRPTSCGNC